MKSQYIALSALLGSALVFSSCKNETAALADNAGTEAVSKSAHTSLNTEFSKMLKGNVVTLEGDKFVETDVRDAEHYLVYFTASWWAPCKDGAAQLVQTYKDKIADNKNVELVLISADRDEKSALKFSKEFGFPWPQVLPKKASEEWNFMKHSTGGVPQYLLVDKDGKKVADGKDEAFDKLGFKKS